MKTNQNNQFLYALLAAAAFLYLRTFLLPATPFIVFGDEVHYFLHAIRMLHGELPYRDFFTFVFPGTDYLYEAVFRILGFHQWVGQGLLLVLGLLLTGTVMWISSTILRGRLMFLPALLFLVFDFSSALDATHHWWSTLSVLLAMGLLLKGRDSRRLAAAGALCGLATLFTQTEGGFSLLAILLYLLMTHRGQEGRVTVFREIALLVAPFVLVTGSVIGYLAARIGLRTIFYWTIYFPLKYFPTVPAHTPSAYFLEIPVLRHPGDILGALPYLIVHLLVPFSYLFCIVRLIRQRDRMEAILWRKILLLTLIGLATCASVINAATYLRLCVVAPPAFILAVWLLSGTATASRSVRAGLWTLGAVSFCYMAISQQVHPRTYVDTPTGRAAFTSPARYEKVSWFASRTHPGETFFNEPFVALALSLKSPGPIDYVFAGEFTRPQQVDTLLASMEAHQTRFIYLYSSLYVSPHPGDNLDPLRAYIAANYHLANENAAGQTWERSSAGQQSEEEKRGSYAP